MLLPYDWFNLKIEIDDRYYDYLINAFLDLQEKGVKLRRSSVKKSDYCVYVDKNGTTIIMEIPTVLDNPKALYVFLHKYAHVFYDHNLQQCRNPHDYAQLEIEAITYALYFIEKFKTSFPRSAVHKLLCYLSGRGLYWNNLCKRFPNTCTHD